MTTFGKTIRTGVAAALMLAGITTGVQGQVVMQVKTVNGSEMWESPLSPSNSRLSQNARKMVVGAQKFLRFGRLGACVL